jgi:TetR/AcrR family transcriptional regulator, transcriptional repressor for nem operon
MARQREFDETIIIEKATNLFWKKGYNAVSTQDLIDAFGISRSSMYGAYKDKRNLFIITLQHYRKTASQGMIDVLNSNNPFKETITQLLNQLIKDTISDNDNKGCFIVNTAIELAPHDTEILEIIVENRKNIISALATSIEKGIKNGEIETTQKPESLANYFYNLINGLRVDSKVHKDQNNYKEIVEIAISVLDNRKGQQVTMYIKNRRISNKFKASGSYQTLCITESSVIRNRLLFIY